jgi:hypothetical protein
MGDINIFEVGCKTVRRTFEAAQDFGTLANEFVNDIRTNMLCSLLQNRNAGFAEREQYNIADQAIHSLDQNDTSEAAHQFRREIYLDSILPDKTDKHVDAFARAGLQALTEHKSAQDTIHIAREGSYNADLKSITEQQQKLTEAANDIKKEILEIPKQDFGGFYYTER